MELLTNIPKKRDYGVKILLFGTVCSDLSIYRNLDFLLQFPLLFQTINPPCQPLKRTYPHSFAGIGTGNSDRFPQNILKISCKINKL